MNEVWARVALVVGTLAVAALFALWRRNREHKPIRDVDPGGLGQGVYFFSSSACPTCAKARRTLDDRLGAGGYVEFVWEQSPGEFAELEVGAVPAVLIVKESGSGRIFPGQPERALRSV